ncbi:MAG: hypothetical protein IPL63_02520 [Saprospiraceae bacterium]|nr:hypothetical protein [Saprospiraceae bacterium]
MILAEIYLKNNKIPMAQIELNEIIKNNESDIQARFLFTNCLISEEKILEAERFLHASISLLPQQSALYVLLIKLYRTKSKFFTNSNEKVQKYFHKAFINVKEYSYQLWTERAKWLIEVKNNKISHIEALNILKKNINLNPNYSHSRTELGLLYQTSPYVRDLDESIKVLDKAIKITKDEAPRVVLIRSYILRIKESDLSNARNIADWSDAKNLAEEVLAKKPSVAHHNREFLLDLIKIYEHFER